MLVQNYFMAISRDIFWQFNLRFFLLDFFQRENCTEILIGLCRDSIRIWYPGLDYLKWPRFGLKSYIIKLVFTYNLTQLFQHTMCTYMYLWPKSFLSVSIKIFLLHSNEFRIEIFTYRCCFMGGGGYGYGV